MQDVHIDGIGTIVATEKSERMPAARTRRGRRLSYCTMNDTHMSEERCGSKSEAGKESDSQSSVLVRCRGGEVIVGVGTGNCSNVLHVQKHVPALGHDMQH